jgi:hypothetical protein
MHPILTCHESNFLSSLLSLALALILWPPLPTDLSKILTLLMLLATHVQLSAQQ